MRKSISTPAYQDLPLIRYVSRMSRMGVVSALRVGFQDRCSIEFQGRFATESACAEYLFARRWPDGFICPGLAGAALGGFKTKAFTYEWLPRGSGASKCCALVGFADQNLVA